ncbi:hypothetical protein [Marichromatium bheemlicum]|uniref:Uncharacterized protein n=1 Tax=Marichromatium bheemlicum TaxID=365339 RepID=A0ABX1I7S9_9GAMM|nr:hypothetical protein [Marichromatium bheemlicum]NKN32455.1 hypothetical protein [Marichromatium bheemlicum]
MNRKDAKSAKMKKGFQPPASSEEADWSRRVAVDCTPTLEAGGWRLEAEG